MVGSLRADMPAVTRQLSRQLKQKSVKTKVGRAVALGDYSVGHWAL